MSKQTRVLKQQQKSVKNERKRQKLIQKLGNDAGNGSYDFLDSIHRVLGSVQAALCRDDPNNHERGVKVRGLQHIASAETVTLILEKLTIGEYPVLEKQPGGTYTSSFRPGSDECNYLRLMVLATENGVKLTPEYVRDRLGIDEEVAEIMLEESSDKKGPLFKSEGSYVVNEDYWR